MKIVTIVGARPQFVKAAAVTRVLHARRDTGARVPEEIVIHTGQHYDPEMSRIFFDELEMVRPHHHLGIGSGSHQHQVGAMLVALATVLGQEHPDLVLSYGDTNSTLAAALTAAQMGLTFAHVEAGLRSHRRDMVEEINRVVADRLASLLFAPSDVATANLRAEGIDEGVFQVGDVMRDVLDWRLNRIGDGRDVMPKYDVVEGCYAVATIHRAENTDAPGRLQAIIHALQRVARSGLDVIFPVHPRTRAVLLAEGLQTPELRIVPPLSYDEVIALMRNSRVILTDSGGIQKEAYWLGVPCVTLREETEWSETVEAGWNVLAGDDSDRIVEAALGGRPVQQRRDLYGDGRAAERIVDVLVAWSGAPRP